MASSGEISAPEHPWALHLERLAPDVVCVELAGSWRKEDRLPDPGQTWLEIRRGPPVHRLTFETARIGDWDSGLVTFVIKLLEETRASGIQGDRAGLPDGVQRLLRLAEAVPERQTGRARGRRPWLATVGDLAIASAREMLAGL